MEVIDPILDWKLEFTATVTYGGDDGFKFVSGYITSDLYNDALKAGELPNVLERYRKFMFDKIEKVTGKK